jgi:hypothetical protein
MNILNTHCIKYKGKVYLFELQNIMTNTDSFFCFNYQSKDTGKL